MASPTSVDIGDFAASQLTLLDAELKAELESTALLLSHTFPASLQRAGLAILNLTVASQRTGLGGKTVLDLELDSAIGNGGQLPEHGIRTGDIVSVQDQPKGTERKKELGEMKKKGLDGVVVRVGAQRVSVALEGDGDEGLGSKLWLVKLANDVTHKRMKQTITRMQKLSESEHSPFLRVLFGQSSPAPVPENLDHASDDIKNFEFSDSTLNESQKEAIKFALCSREIALIHGPPGTGKTHTLIELILQVLRLKQRVLVCGPSNISVDNIVERLAPHKVAMVRLGHPARLLPSVLDHSLDVLTQTSEAASIVRDVRKEMDDKQRSIRKTRNGRERKAIYGDLRELRKEFRDREKRCVGNLVGGSQVVLATLHGAGGYQLRHEQFDVVIIDEASQALEAQCWIALLSAKKAVLAGDHLQLPPTIKSLNSRVKTPAVAKDKKMAMTLETTLFDRLLALHGPSIKRMLTTQYRMHEKIMRFPSEELYDSLLIAAPAVASRLLPELPYDVDETEDTLEPLVFYDTQGGEFPETTEDEEVGKRGGLGAESKSNAGEVSVVVEHVQKLIAAGVRAEDIAIITPYNAQLALLSQALREQFSGLELGSVDGFQGREKEAVVVSLVRSNAAHDVGFLGEKRRLNVAMTRPKRQLCVVGDSDTVGRGSGFLKRWMAFLEENADLRYPEPGG